MKKIRTITVAKKDYVAVKLAILDTCRTDVESDIGYFKARVAFLATDEEWNNFKSMIEESGICIKG